MRLNIENTKKKQAAKEKKQQKLKAKIKVDFCYIKFNHYKTKHPTIQPTKLYPCRIHSVDIFNLKHVAPYSKNN